MYINTNKTLCLPKKQFSAPKMTASEFKKKILEIIKTAAIKNNITEINTYFTNPEYNNVDIIRLSLPLLINEAPDTMSHVTKSLSNKNEQIAITPFELADDCKDHGKIITLDNGFTYIQLYCGFGDDTWIPYLIAFYIDNDGYINAYAPTYGNFMFAEVANATLAEVFVGEHENEINKLVKTYGATTSTALGLTNTKNQTPIVTGEIFGITDENLEDAMNDGIVAIIHMYGQKYGMEDSSSGTISDFINSYEIDDEEQYNILEISPEYCAIEIAANVTVTE